tara:strand:- start:4 stop:576 length:573 start_codon:yes stop_codon:yes gene_type:complete
MKAIIKILTIFVIFFNLNYLNSSEVKLDKKFVSLKDFLILKFDLFFKNNISNVFKGGGMLGIAYQSINYDIKIDGKDKIIVHLNAIMNENRYKSKKYYPKLKDCNQVRNKILVNKYGYSFWKQTLNYQVNSETLTNSLESQVLNISSLDKKVKKFILENTEIKINIIHPKNEKSLSCYGRLIDDELRLKN